MFFPTTCDGVVRFPPPPLLPSFFLPPSSSSSDYTPPLPPQLSFDWDFLQAFYFYSFLLLPSASPPYPPQLSLDWDLVQASVPRGRGTTNIIVVLVTPDAII